MNEAPKRPLTMEKGWTHKPCGGPAEVDLEWHMAACAKCGQGGELLIVPLAECEKP